MIIEDVKQVSSCPFRMMLNEFRSLKLVVSQPTMSSSSQVSSGGAGYLGPKVGLSIFEAWGFDQPKLSGITIQ